MTPKQIELLARIKEPNHFIMLLNSIANQYNRKEKIYDSFLNEMNYTQGHNNIPEKLYKYIDFEGGINSIINSTLQFSHPLSFRNESHPLGDLTEFWFDRLYIDQISLDNYISELEKKHQKKVNIIEAYSLFLYQTVMNTVERNKVLCLSLNNKNEYLKSMYPTGFCIEYNTTIFKNKNQLIGTDSSESIIYNKVQYVEEIVPYPVRFDNHNWLSNYLFIKNSNKYSLEEEFRVVHTKDYIDDFNKSNRKEKFAYAYKRLFDLHPGNTSPLRFKIDRNLISHVYYDNNIKEENKLLSVLKQYNIKYTKII